MMNRWKYQFLDLSDDISSEDLNRLLKDVGKLGWELAAVLPMGLLNRYFLKRRIV